MLDGSTITINGEAYALVPTERSSTDAMIKDSMMIEAERMAAERVRRLSMEKGCSPGMDKQPEQSVNTELNLLQNDLAELGKYLSDLHEDMSPVLLPEDVCCEGVMGCCPLNPTSSVRVVIQNFRDDVRGKTLLVKSLTERLDL